MEDGGAHVLVVLIVDVPKPHRLVPGTSCHELSSWTPSHTFHLSFYENWAVKWFDGIQHFRHYYQLSYLAIIIASNTSFSCPSRLAPHSNWPLLLSHTATVPSKLALARYLPHGDQDTHRTVLSRPAQVLWPLLIPGVAFCEDGFASPLVTFSPPKPDCLVLPTCG